VAPKADRDALEAELDAAGANWQMLNFGGRIHSFAEELLGQRARCLAILRWRPTNGH
jgi:hypothetical protein